MRKALFVLGLLSVGYAYAQDGKVGINTNGNSKLPGGGVDNSGPKATLDIRVAKDNANTPEGILIPRVSRSRAKVMDTAVEESTLIYINNLDGDKTGTVADVDAKGFYYFAGGKWVKMGSGASNASSSGSVGNLENVIVTSKLVKISGAIPNSSWDNNVFTVIGTGNPLGITLPDPSGDNEGRIISFRNESSSQRNYTGNFQPQKNSAINSGRGHLLQSDGTEWFVIGGF